MRDCDYQKNRLLFRNNIMRIGEYEAFEISLQFVVLHDFHFLYFMACAESIEEIDEGF